MEKEKIMSLCVDVDKLTGELKLAKNVADKAEIDYVKNQKKKKKNEEEKQRTISPRKTRRNRKRRCLEKDPRKSQRFSQKGCQQDHLLLVHSLLGLDCSQTRGL